jgi:hypothetical protein
VTKYYAKCSGCGLSWPLSDWWILARLRWLRLPGTTCPGSTNGEGMSFRKRAL